MRHIFSCTIIAPLLTLSLSCCASQYGSQRTIVRYYPSCYRPIYDLRRSEHNVARVTAGTALVGALLGAALRSEEHTSELQSPRNLVCRLLLEKKNMTSSA